MGLLARAAAPYREGLAGIDRRAYLVVSVTLLAVAARMSVYTFLGIYLTRDVGFSLQLVGLGLLVENALRGLVAPVAGAISDRVGRRAVIMAAASLTGSTLPFFLLVSTPAQLLAWSAALGVAQAGLWPATSALLLDLAPPERRQAALSLNYTAISVGYTLGVAPAGFVLLLGFPALALASAGGFLAIILVVLLAIRGPLPATRGDGPRGSFRADLARAPRDSAFLSLAALAFVFPLGIGLIASVAPLYGQSAGLPESAIGLALATNGPLLAIFAIPVAARLGAHGPYRFLALSAAILALAYLPLVLSGGFAALVIATLIFTLGELVFSSALPTAVASLAPPGLRGAYQGAWAAVFSLGTGTAVVLSGVLRDLVGWPGAWIVWSGMTAAAALGLALARPALRRIADARAQPPSAGESGGGIDARAQDAGG